jgi:Multiubiquitin
MTSERADKAAPEKKMVTIFVNTIEHEVPHKKISYETLVEMAFPGAPGTTYIVKYYKGNSDNLTGTLPSGGEVMVKDGMDFRITGTGES